MTAFAGASQNAAVGRAEARAGVPGDKEAGAERLAVLMKAPTG